MSTIKTLDRRDFLKLGTAGVGTILAGRLMSSPEQAIAANKTMIGYKAPPMDVVRIGFVGVGGQGTSHVENFLKIPGVEVKAVCDIIEERVARAQKMVEDAGQKKPEGYSRGPRDFERLCDRDDIELVFNSTPWEWHVPVSLAAMESGKHTAMEVPAATRIEDCWKLVDTSENTRRHCIMMENCNYDKVEMMILNMVKKGLFGELLHAECGYLHDLRGVKFDVQGEGAWRRAHSMTSNGDLYPTHGLGPIAQCFDINRGNGFDYLVSAGTKTRGLHLYALEQFGAGSEQAKETYRLSDIVTTLIRTKNGETIIVKHDTNSPRPYSRDILVQGTKGIVRKYPEAKIYIEGKSEPHRWDPLDAYLQEHNHPIWADLEEKSKGAGHGGMDFIEDYRLIQTLRKGLVPDMDVYDAAAISAVTELSGKSIRNDGEPQKFPDFTRGGWKAPRVLEAMRVENEG
ncbi:MAG TPA: Gfo/Idh/MocA family oxidoreductase [Bacteroidota bacterium]|nr:Gfo/Idh/MocA family oxidoreductase [Bacteroidota bacterium]